MSPTLPVCIETKNPDRTGRLAAGIAAILSPGDTLLLDGPIGAGKSHFARAVIRAACDDPAMDVPSPTFTLVQTYDTGRGEIWHADLYRLGTPDDVLELGLDDAFATAICLIEWPDRLSATAPTGALHIDIAVTAETGRALTFAGPASWANRLGPVLRHCGMQHAVAR